MQTSGCGILWVLGQGCLVQFHRWHIMHAICNTPASRETHLLLCRAVHRCLRERSKHDSIGQTWEVGYAAQPGCICMAIQCSLIRGIGPAPRITA